MALKRQRRLSAERLEERALLAVVTQVGYFDTWDGGIIPSTDVAGIAYHPGSGSLYLADSEIDEISQFQGNNIFRSSLDGQQLYQEIASGNKEPTGITYNEFDQFFYVTNDDNHTIQRYDSNLNNPLATVFTLADVPNATDPEGITSDPSTGYLYVVDGHNGGTQVLAYDSNLVFAYSFPVSGQLSDGEGIAFNPDNNHLFVVSSADNLIVEYALNGAFVDQYDINNLTPDPGSPQGLTFAPTSDPLDDPNNLALYIADGGLDNFPDGGVFEVLVSGGQLAQNTAPLVNAGGNQEFFLDSFPTNVGLNAAVADDDLPGPPGSLTTLWSQVSGPAAVSFADPTAIDPTVTLPAAGTYVLRLTADDGQLITSDDTTIVVGQGVEVRVTASSDDAEERIATGKVILTSADLDLGKDAGGSTVYDQIVGLRFSGLSIPQGAVIQNAYIQFQADETTSAATSLTIEGEDTDDAPTFTTTKWNISTRSRTTSFVSWSPVPWTKGDAGADQQTPNIAAVIQEIVNRSGWSSGNDLAIIISGTGERVAESYDGSLAPLLIVEFTLPGVTIIESSGTTDVTEGGPADSYTVVLDSAPTANVDVTVTPDSQTDLGAGAGTAIVLTFTPANALIPQPVNVTALDDAIAEGPHTSTITHAAASADSNYSGLPINNVVANITDNDTAGVTITESGGTTDVTEGGPTDSYTMVLDSEPTANVDVTVTPDSQTDLGAGAGTAIVLTFTPANALTPQPVNVTALDDAVAEGPHTSTITHAAASADSNYSGLPINNVVANITDNDTAGVTITESGGMTDVTEGGGADSYTVVLDSIPTANVDVTVTPDSQTDLGAGAGTAIVLNFTPANALTPQPVNVTAVDDAVAEGLHSSTITHAAASADTNYNGLPINNVVANITDNDTAGVTLTESGGTTDVTEGGPTDSYTMVLDSEPTANVDVTVTPDSQTDLGAGAGTAIVLTFTPANALIPQPVNVTAVDDAIAEGPHTSTITHVAASADSNYSGLPINNVVANITDNDTAGVTIIESGGTTDVTEGGPADSYTVVLDSEPTANVDVTVTPDSQTDLGAGAGTAIVLTFTPANALIPQPVNVTALDDAIAEGPHTSTITHAAASADSNYSGLPINNVVANITDNDTVGVTITESGGTTDVTEGGPTDSYTVVLDSEPTANVDVTVTPDSQTDLGAGAGTAIVLTFTPANALIPQPVNVTALDDAVAEGPHTSTITHAAASADSNYSGLPINNVVANITDNDTAGVTITESGGTTDVTEGGPTDSYTVVLDSEPTANVDVTVTPDSQTDLGAGAGTAIVLTFTPANALTPQPVNVTALDDAVAEGPHTSTITHAAASADSNYSGLPINNVVANITDNDTAGVTITESGGTTDVTEGGPADSYTVVLDSEPTANVDVTVTPDSQTDLGAGAGTAIVLTFTPANCADPATGERDGPRRCGRRRTAHQHDHACGRERRFELQRPAN